MSKRYYQSYDAYGEPVTIIRIPPAPSYPAGEPLDRFAREAAACIDAEAAYEQMRHEGASHAEARAAIKEKFGV